MYIMNAYSKIALAIFSVVFALTVSLVGLATYRSKCSCLKTGREGMEGSRALSSSEYYTLSSLIAQIEKDDPEFEYAFDITAVLQIGSAHAAYAAVLNTDASVGEKISGVKALLEEEPVKEHMHSAFTTPPPDSN